LRLSRRRGDARNNNSRDHRPQTAHFANVAPPPWRWQGRGYRTRGSVTGLAFHTACFAGHLIDSSGISKDERGESACRVDWPRSFVSGCMSMSGRTARQVRFHLDCVVKVFFCTVDRKFFEL
jgi:hypothetical protein